MKYAAFSRWFSVAQLDRDTFAISEPLHWEEPHCYLLLGTERAALIDTGLGVSRLRPVVDALTALPVLVLTTHAHWDHIGSHGEFSSVAVHEAEAGWLSGNFPLPLSVVRQNLTAHPCPFPEDFSLDSYQIYQGGATKLLFDGQRIDLGGRTLEVLHTPGHSPGHCCFFERARGALFSGDLIYAGCLDAFYPTTDPRAFAGSVRRVRALPVSQIFPGHHAFPLSPGLTAEIDAAFSALEKEKKLFRGAGLFAFERVSIHL